MDRKTLAVSIILLNIGLAIGYAVAFSIYQPRLLALELDTIQFQADTSELQTQIESLNSSLRDTQLMLSGWKEGDNIVASESWFFTSIAPYQNETHECYYHVIRCMAEMTNAQIFYSIEEVDGSFFIQGRGDTGNNGFLDIYLPLNRTFQMSINVNGLKGEVTITTFPDSPTCITTPKVE
jgi:hypothetical protein